MKKDSVKSIKSIVAGGIIVIAALSILAEGAPYKRLSLFEKNDFNKSYVDLLLAYKQRRFDVFKQIAPEVITYYRSILLDPGCASLRPKYLKLDTLISQLHGELALDSLNDSYANAQNDEAKIKSLDGIVSYYRTSGDVDKFQTKTGELGSLVKAYLEKNKSIDAYAVIGGLKNIDPGVIADRQKMIEANYKETFLRLSAEGDIDSLRAFQQKYPQIYREDIANLIDMHAKNMKVSILRKPSAHGLQLYLNEFGMDKEFKEKMRLELKKAIQNKHDYPIEDIETYFRIFPEDDPAMFAYFEDRLYSDFSKNVSTETAMTYIKYYPNGRYSVNINNWMNNKFALVKNPSDSISGVDLNKK